MKEPPASRSWWKPCLAALTTTALLLACAWQVDLEPRVDRDFFFARSDPALEEERRIQRRFGELSQVIVVVSGPPLASSHHLESVTALSEAIEGMPGVRAVRSLARGPAGLGDARESPLWSRLLLAGDDQTSFILVEVEPERARAPVVALEALVAQHAGRDLDLALAGVPYTIEVMRRKLVRDFAVFSAAAVLVFAVATLIVFRSGWILVGMLLCCSGAVAATLLALQAAGFGIGLLTANLTTIVFVLTQSHVVFMTSNWQHLARKSEGGDAGDLAARARRHTLRPSLASAATTLLGFASLLFVPARPLRELGAGGSIGALIAFAAVYLALPVFLERARPRSRAEHTPGLFRAARGRALALGLACAVLAVGMLRLETDPSLLAFFDSDGEVHAALERLDVSGGSSPLFLVVELRDRARLDRRDAYRQMWALQRALETDAAVGRVLSLPVLLAEAERFELSFLLSWEWIVDLLGPETTGVFLTRDRRQAVYLLQMAESRRDALRTQVVARLRGIARDQGFEVPLVGGIYALQGRLAELVARSVLWSLAALGLLFFAVAALAARSLRVGVAAGMATSLVPAATLGGFGALAVPLDVIAAPAAGVGFGLAADAALHLVSAWRRAGAQGSTSWRAAAREQWPGIVRCSGLVALGFTLFALSSFPPTRRFGLGVAFATALGALLALWVLPTLAQHRALRRRRAL